MDNPTLSQSPSPRVNASQSAGPDSSASAAAAIVHPSVVDSSRDSLQRARKAAHEAVERLSAGASDLVDRIENKAQGIGEMPRRAWSYSRSTVQDHPIQAVAVALLAGYAIARLLSLRNWR